MPFFMHNGNEYHVMQWEGPGAVPLLLLHGFAQSAATWNEVAPFLAQDRFVVALDLVGHGKSAKPRDLKAYEMPAISETIEAFCLQGGWDRIDLAGYSAGGRIALRYALMHPKRVRSLVLESAGLGWESEDEHAALCRRDADWERRLQTEDIATFMDYWESLPLFASQRLLPGRTRAQLRARRLANDPLALAFTVHGTGQHTMQDCRAGLAALCAPVLYIAGTYDPKYSQVACSLEDTDGIEVVLLEAGHDVHTENPDAFLAAVKGFLSRLS